MTVTREPGRNYDLVVECSGSAAGLGIAIDRVRPRGTIVLKSTVASPGSVHLNDIVVNELTVIGSRCGPLDEAIAWMEAGRLQLSHLNMERYRFRDYAVAFERARTANVYKVLFEPG